jgi:hypothetical protein
MRWRACAECFPGDEQEQTMIELDEQLQRLADSLELPATTPADDLARGRARRRHRNLGVAGAALTTAAVIGTSVVLLSGGGGASGAGPGFAGDASTPSAKDGVRTETKHDANRQAQLEALQEKEAVRLVEGRHVDDVLSGYRDILREDLDPAGTRIQAGPITNQQSGGDALGTKLDWNGGGMLQVAVGRSLEGVQFFCDGACDRRSLAEASKALVRTSGGRISVAVFQDDGDIVALTADTSFGNNGTSTGSLGLTVEQLLAAAADPRFDLPDGLDLPGPPDEVGQSAGTTGTE